MSRKPDMRSLAVLAVAAASAWSLAEDPVKILFQPPQGAVYNETIDFNLTISSFEVKVNQVREVTVAEVADGKVKLRQKTLRVTQSMNGEEQTQEPDATVTESLRDQRNRVVERSRTAEEDDTEQRFNAALRLTFPEGEVKVGDSWKEVYATDDQGRLPSEGHYKLEAIEELDGRKTYKIAFNNKATDETGGGAEGYFWVDAQTGVRMRTEASLKHFTIQGMTAEGTITSVTKKA